MLKYILLVEDLMLDHNDEFLLGNLYTGLKEAICSMNVLLILKYFKELHSCNFNHNLLK